MMHSKILSRLQRPLLVKLLAINFLLILFVIGFIWFAVDYLAASYLSALMQDYHISPDDAHNMFVISVHRYLFVATLIALALVAVLGIILTRYVLKPVRDMNRVVQEMARGDYSSRVQSTQHDEVGQLAMAFNHLADQLVRVEQLRDDMVVDVAHELRTPLTNLRGYLEAMQDKVVTPSPEAFELLRNEVHRLIDLVESLQRMTQANASKGHLNYSAINIETLVIETRSLYRQRLDERELQLQTTISDNLPAVNADRNMLLQILSNMFDNATRYTPTGGWIKLDIKHTSDSIRFSLSNKSEPIDQAELPLLSERFYRTEQSRSRESGGAGIGLAIVKQLIEAHQGKFDIKSLQDGISIDFSLPARPTVFTP